MTTTDPFTWKAIESEARAKALRFLIAEPPEYVNSMKELTVALLAANQGDEVKFQQLLAGVRTR